MQAAAAEWESIKWLASQGIGTLLAGFMFVAYRQDQKKHVEDLREEKTASAERIKEAHQKTLELATDFRAIIQENTKAVTALTALVQQFTTMEEEYEKKQGNR